jgi:hypothetical protein
MKRYYVHPSYTDDMGYYVGFNVEADNVKDARDVEALWEYNNVRDHDGLPRWDKLPKHIKVTRI